MAPELPEKVLGIDINKGDDRSRQSRSEREEEDRVRFIFFSVGSHRLAAPVNDVRTTTEVPADMTAVPRSPDAIEGVTDLRGEITAVIDPTVHFPADLSDGDREQLLVFDRNADQQAAAIHVNDVYGVDALPESDVFDDETITDSVFDGDALEHPLVTALLKRERRSERERLHNPADGPDTVDSRNGAVIESIDTADNGSEATSSASTADTTQNTIAETPADTEGRTSPNASQTVIEATPVLNVSKLLRAAGHLDSTQQVLESPRSR
ncbi:CheW protein [Natrialba chahannaoensis JCM 10990]|uniref:CheW protein n=1 Tax=Natrialba chahannaoensis JCM 10990 TaxID=1227492 RepID=M0A9M8_9EURY|nr:chemotaxis protein CheW [Natrialba chahannaoensis]ELY95244.1 CheW protein [Natrialba chahannaoensis JCM 10990]